MSTDARCRDCGARGLEDDTDLMPGICPPCFDQRVAPVFASATTLDALLAGLIAVGCHPERITAHVVAQVALLKRRN